MTIDFKQPKYILPLIALPFLCLFFYVWHSGFSKSKPHLKNEAAMQTQVGDVSPDVRKKELANKLDAYRNTYKEADGYTAVTSIAQEKSIDPSFSNQYNSKEKTTLDSIDRQMKKRYESPPGRQKISPQDKELAAAVANLSGKRRGQQKDPPPAKEKDPMEMFKAQMAYMDSLNKSNDPAFKAEVKRKAELAKAEEQRSKQPNLTVTKAEGISGDFNTVKPDSEPSFIKAIIDENVTGYAGSRIRLRLLDDIKAGNKLIRKGTYLYALISGFTGQRVTLSVKTIIYGDLILPVKLDIYDLDGLPGLYVPESAFRDFTKDASTNTMQGTSLDNGSSSGSQFVMSSVDKIFQSTSSAVAGMIRKDKAKIKYNSYLYLIDTEALQNAPKTN
jgi:conjugative transposon TraM protein